MSVAAQTVRTRSSTGRMENQGGVKAAAPNLLPAEGRCNICELTKPIAEMVVVHYKREKVYYMRPRCKDCHNEKERGHRREWKRKYLSSWRARNKKLADSYWQGDPDRREKARINAARRLQNEEHHEAVLIQGRFSRRGMSISLKEAKEFLKQFGRCYPSRFGLTRKGLQRCEQIRSQLRRRGTKRISTFEIRLMVYGDSLLGERNLVIKPSRQPRPYQSAAEKLRQWWEQRRAA